MTNPAKFQFPKGAWSPPQESCDWSREGLERVQHRAVASRSAAIMVVHKGRVILDWGETARKFNCHSIRKSLLSALIGVYADRGLIDLSRNLTELQVDDEVSPLTEVEKKATVRDLLQARSGIYLRAYYEAAGGKPERGAHLPGEHWQYNNWDFNALGTIFEKCAGESIAGAFKTYIADPLEMQDFEISDVVYVGGPLSRHPAYPFRMSARDLARFGLLYLCNGKWDGAEVVPSRWVAESTTTHSPSVLAEAPGFGYGYMWWTVEGENTWPGVCFRDPCYAAVGFGGHLVLVMPYADLVIVNRADTDRALRLSNREIGKLLNLVLCAGGMADPNYRPGLEDLTDYAKVPLPSDVEVRLPDKNSDPDLSTFSGRWQGTSDNGAALVLIIERIHFNTCRAVYAWRSLGLGGDSGWRRVHGRFVDGALKMTLDFGANVAYRMSTNGTLVATLDGYHASSTTTLQKSVQYP